MLCNIMRGKRLPLILSSGAWVLMTLASCSASLRSSKLQDKALESEQAALYELLKEPSNTSETQYALVNKIASNLLSTKDYPKLVHFLTCWVEDNPNDPYAAYWLSMTAYAYLENNAEPIAEYYFERAVDNCSDLLVRGQSVHFLCMENLVRINETPANRILYLNRMLSHYIDEARATELLYRLAVEYGKEGEWHEAIATYERYLQQEDASSVQIAGYPNAYLGARQLIDFANSSKDWTFETLDALVGAVKRGISSYDPAALERCKSKVNFFAMSWHQEETDMNAQESFSMRSFMRGNKITYNDKIDPSSSPTEAYLRTTGWSTYVNVWYLYFRKVNFPADPEIHGRWEWAGIYYGEKL